MGTRDCLEDKLGNGGIMDFSYNLPEDTNVCFKVLVVWYTSKK